MLVHFLALFRSLQAILAKKKQEDSSNTFRLAVKSFAAIEIEGTWSAMPLESRQNSSDRGTACLGWIHPSRGFPRTAKQGDRM